VSFVEEVFKNKGGLFGGHTGRKYAAGDVEKKGGEMWSKPSFAAPGEIVLEIEPSGQTVPDGNGRGSKC
jgi:hypothetical protein